METHVPPPADHRPLFKMFNQVPPGYDRMNRLLTWRLDECWRKKAARKCLEGQPEKVLDLCTGTGDLVVHLARMSGKEKREIHALDFSRPMLELAEIKAKRRCPVSIRFTEGDVAELPYADGYFDAISIGFAFRNLTFHNPKTTRYLAEILRVLRTGGRFVIVETAQPRRRWMRSVYRLYMKVMVAWLGGKLSGHPGAYHYLAHSAIHFYSPPEVKDLLLKAGFNRVESHPLLGGIAAIYVAVK